jgi:hypothetical protein
MRLFIMQVGELVNNFVIANSTLPMTQSKDPRSFTSVRLKPIAILE